ncbi:MAG: EFR1 family ferrodoxin [Clostridia bacterium]|nr:EFR1 family ferrodoxin [Clostridia bacterium]
MSTYNVFFSPTGGTKKVADVVCNVINENHKNIDLSKNVDKIVLDENDVCVVSVPSFGGRVPALATENLKNITANGAKAILVCVYGNRVWDDTLSELQDVAESIGFVVVGGVVAVAEHSIFRQFATGRPDNQDVDELKQFAQQIKQKLDAGNFEKIVLPGSHGEYKVYNGSSFKPTANEECVECGICADNCPVNAISCDNVKECDVTKCISCMRCIIVCPVKARGLDEAVVNTVAQKMAPAFEGRKKNYLFL